MNYYKTLKALNNRLAPWDDVLELAKEADSEIEALERVNHDLLIQRDYWADKANNKTQESLAICIS